MFIVMYQCFSFNIFCKFALNNISHKMCSSRYFPILTIPLHFNQMNIKFIFPFQIKIKQYMQSGYLKKKISQYTVVAHLQEKTFQIDTNCMAECPNQKGNQREYCSAAHNQPGWTMLDHFQIPIVTYRTISLTPNFNLFLLNIELILDEHARIRYLPEVTLCLVDHLSIRVLLAIYHTDFAWLFITNACLIEPGTRFSISFQWRVVSLPKILKL